MGDGVGNIYAKHFIDAEAGQNSKDGWANVLSQHEKYQK